MSLQLGIDKETVQLKYSNLSSINKSLRSEINWGAKSLKGEHSTVMNYL